MHLTLSPRTVLVFDLDDTLYKEIDFVWSAFHAIARALEPELGQDIFAEMRHVYLSGGNAIDHVKQRYSITNSVSELVHIYRYHKPDIKLDRYTRTFLERVQRHGFKCGLVTDGRSETQRNKLQSLELSDFFDTVVISEEFGSEKPCAANYQTFEHQYPGYQCIMFGDNPIKDFIRANELGWMTIGIRDDGRHIHNQNIELTNGHQPSFYIKSFDEIQLVIEP